jgi:hypothetical protein
MTLSTLSLDETLNRAGALIASPAYKASIALVETNRGARCAAQAAPSAFLRSQGVDVPSGAKVTAIPTQGGLSLCINVGRISIYYHK